MPAWLAAFGSSGSPSCASFGTMMMPVDLAGDEVVDLLELPVGVVVGDRVQHGDVALLQLRSSWRLELATQYSV